MAAVAYDLNRFAGARQQEKQPVRMRVVKTRDKKNSQLMRMARIVLVAIVFLILVCGVLYTQTTITELQSQISEKNNDLVEAESQSDFLGSALESMSNIRNIEQRAEELGLVRANGNQITYVRVNEGEEISVKENGLSRLFEKTRAGLLLALDYINP